MIPGVGAQGVWDYSRLFPTSAGLQIHQSHWRMLAARVGARDGSSRASRPAAERAWLVRMNTPEESPTRTELATVIVLFSILAYVLAPFTFGDKSVSVPRLGHEADGIQQCLLMADGMDKLLSRPLSYYDTAILYPDRNQLRTTEPYLGFPLLGLPLRTVLGLGDVDAFEVLRCLILLAAMTYAYLLFRAIEIGPAISLAGAVLCVGQPDLVNGIDRLPVLSITLILPVFYHGLMAWRSPPASLGHKLGLFFWTALYPLCGLINGAAAVLAALFILPLAFTATADLRRQHRLGSLLIPMLLAVVVDAIVLAPWLLDRADLRVYVSDAFLQLKHWNPARVPLRVAQLPDFIGIHVGLGLTAGLIMLIGLAATRRLHGERHAHTTETSTTTPERRLLIVIVPALALVGVSAYDARVFLPSVRILFQAGCSLAILEYWRTQRRFAASAPSAALSPYAAIISAGVGVFLVLMSFGPVYSSNSHPLATYTMTVLLEVLRPLRSIREFSRLWIFGLLFLSMYVTLRVGIALRQSSPAVQMGAAAILIAAAMSSIYNRQLFASADVAAPGDVIELASYSRSTGAMYVHPNADWNSIWGVRMIQTTRELDRPIVNGYLGFLPPWYEYASSVLRRFPDAEALWLLKRWKVDTVLRLVADNAGEPPPCMEKVFDDGRGRAVFELASCPDQGPHPSGDLQAASRHVRVEARWTPGQRTDGRWIPISVPTGFRATALEVRFERSPFDRIPSSIQVEGFDGTGVSRLNRDHSGEWIESLAADALVHRASPIAVIKFSRPARQQLRVSFRNSRKPPIEKMELIGEWAR